MRVCSVDFNYKDVMAFELSEIYSQATKSKSGARLKIYLKDDSVLVFTNLIYELRVGNDKLQENHNMYLEAMKVINQYLNYMDMVCNSGCDSEYEIIKKLDKE